jgi:hypothetical protein
VHALESSRPRRRYPVTVVAWAGLIMARLLPAAGIDLLMARRQRTAAAASHTDRP